MVYVNVFLKKKLMDNINKWLIALGGLIAVMLIIALVMPKTPYIPPTQTPQEIEMRKEQRENRKQAAEELQNKEKDKQLALCISSDKNFITSKMKQMNRDVVSIQRTGNRKYYVSYISWTTGKGRSGDEIIDYSNRRCD